MQRIFLALGSALLFGSLSYADVCDSAQNLVTNCGFETGTLAGWQVSGTQSSPSYLGISYGVDAADAYTGQYGAYFGGFGSVLSIGQTLATTPGATYTISYELAQAPATASPYVNSFSAAFGGATLVSLTQAPQFAFTLYTETATATSNATTLEFSAQDDTGYYSLDDVTVKAAVSGVPEPAPAALLGMAFAAAAILAGRRRFNQASGSSRS